MINVKEQIREEPGGRLQGQVWRPISNQVRAQTIYQIYNQVRDQVRIQVRDQVWNQVNTTF